MQVSTCHWFTEHKGWSFQANPYKEKKKWEIWDQPIYGFTLYSETFNVAGRRRAKATPFSLKRVCLSPHPNSHILDSFSLMMTNVIKALPAWQWRKNRERVILMWHFIFYFLFFFAFKKLFIRGSDDSRVQHEISLLHDNDKISEREVFCDRSSKSSFT